MSQQTESPEDAERRRIAEDIAGRLRRDGVTLNGRESGEELVQILEAKERFDSAVQRQGGDLMVDEPIDGDAPIAPDNEAFVLPQRNGGEDVASFISRIAEATIRAGAAGKKG